MTDRRTQLSSTFDRSLFAAQDIIESGPFRVINLLVMRRLSLIACGCWMVTIHQVLTMQTPAALLTDEWFMSGIGFATAAMIFFRAKRLRAIVSRPTEIGGATAPAGPR